MEKLYGKQKVYWINQNEFGSFDASALSSMEREIAELSREVQTDEEAIKKGENELKILTSSLTVEEAKTQLAQVSECCVPERSNAYLYT